MNKMSAIITAVLTALMSFSCTASSSNDAWKENIVTVDLSTKTASSPDAVFDGNILKITTGGDYEVSGVLEDGYIYVNSTDKVKIRLSGASITNSQGPAIFFDNAKEALITITADTQNYLSDGSGYAVEDADAALFSNDDMEIKGKGFLTVVGNYKHGIASDDDLKIENGNITITSYEHGIKVNDKFELLGGNLDITAKTGKGIKAGLELIVEDGYAKIISLENEGIESKGTLTINGGEIDIDAADDGINTGNESTTDNTNPNIRFEKREGSRVPPIFDGNFPIPPKDMTPPEGGIPMDGIGKGHGVMGGGFGFVDEETAAAHAITINGGKVTVKANGDGIDSNGNFTITGGTVIVDGPEAGGNGPLDSQGVMSITGGTVITLSSAGMLQLPGGEGNQNILKVTLNENINKDDVVTVKNADGTEIMSHTAKFKARALIYSSGKLITGEEYTISVNGSPIEKVTQTQGIASIGNSGYGGGFGSRGERPSNGSFGSNRHDNNKPFFDHTAKPSNSTSQKKEVTVKLNGKPLSFETAPIIRDGTTLVGFRSIFEALGCSVSWEDSTKTVTAKKDGTVIILKIGSRQAVVNDKTKELLQAPEIINGSTMVPVRFISEELGLKVEWDDINKCVSIFDMHNI